MCSILAEPAGAPPHRHPACGRNPRPTGDVPADDSPAWWATSTPTQCRQDLRTGPARSRQVVAVGGSPALRDASLCVRELRRNPVGAVGALHAGIAGLAEAQPPAITRPGDVDGLAGPQAVELGPAAKQPQRGAQLL